MVKKEKFYFKSTNKKNKIFGICWSPEDMPVKAVLQISHGMVEYIERYDEFARYLAAQGIVVVGNDHLGHGSSVDSEEDWGYMDQDGFLHMVEDLYKVERHFKKRFPEVPYFILGHSMGSFVVRYFLMKYGRTIDGAIIMGTAWHSAGTAMFGRTLTSALALVRGWRYRSQMVNRMAFGSYNRAFKPARTEYDWLSRDEANVDAYIGEPRCQFVFTLNAYHELFKGLYYIAQTSHIQNIPKSLPVLFVSGENDPVGARGDGVQKVYDSMALAGMEEMELILYEDARHEILNEINRKDVYQDILEWLDKEITSNS